MSQHFFKHFWNLSAIFFLLSCSLTFAEISSKRTTYQKDLYDSIQTEEQYFKLLKAADENIFKDEFEAEILLLLDEKLREDYTRLSSLEERKSFIEYFWKARNPNPLLPENDRLLDHLIRRTFVRKNFVCSEPPYFDDRGKYYIKYGRPMFRYQDAGGPRPIRSLVIIPSNYYSVKPNESWSYVNVAPNFVVHFAKEGNSYREIRSLKEIIIGTRRRGHLVWYWSDLIKKRFWMSSIFDEAVTEIIEIENGILSSSGGGAAMVNDYDFYSKRIERNLYSNLRYTENETIKASFEVPTSIYRPVHAQNKLSFTDVVAQFRGPQGQTRVEIFILSPLKKYVDRSIPISDDSVNIEFSCMLRDQFFNSLADSRLQRKFPVKLAVSKNLSNTVGNLAVLAPPQQIELFMQVKNNRNGKIGFSQKSLNIRDFNEQNLMVSDIQFFLKLTNANLQKILPVIEKQNIMLAPYPFKKVRKASPLYCYFEIYNLHSIGVKNEYEITYKVYKDETSANILKKLSKWIKGEKHPSISIVYTQPVDKDISQELSEIDLSKLTNGAYQLEIKVSDTKDKTIVARAYKKFILID